MNDEEITLEGVVEIMDRFRTYHMYVAYLFGTPIPVGRARIYVNLGTLKNSLIKELANWFFVYNPFTSTSKSIGFTSRQEQLSKARGKIRVLLTKMEKLGFLEYRRLGDRTPLFPHNIPSLEKEQKEKICKMLDSNDMEMKQLAKVMLEQIKK